MLDYMGSVVQGADMPYADEFREDHMKAYVAVAIVCRRHLPVEVTHSSLGVPVVVAGLGLPLLVALPMVSDSVNKRLVVVWV